MELGGLTGTIRDQTKAAVAPATTQFHWQDPSAQRSAEVKNHVLASLC